ncbi:MAG: glycerate kinase [Candidatus Porifericomitaceae bacterium WSBS_2022_MAG_OTU9]
MAIKIVIAPDSFKGNLSAVEVARAIERGIKRVLPKARCLLLPVADGGEGTVRALSAATDGKLVAKKVYGPLGHSVRAAYAISGDGSLAVLEMAAASGLPLLADHERNALQASTYGTGQLMAAAMRRGVKRIIIGIGGSATCDGGVGMAQALGIRFLDKDGRCLEKHMGGGDLGSIAAIDMGAVGRELRRVRVDVACDVDNPLCGRQGAAAVFAPQKGASPSEVKLLDKNLAHLAKIMKRDLGCDVASLPGSGAAGGLGAGLMAFVGGRLQSGVGLVLDAVRLKQSLRGASLVFTGEGRIDSQTLHGKAPAGVAKLARQCKVPVIALGGGLDPSAKGLFAAGVDGLAAAVCSVQSLDEALANAKGNVTDAAERAMRLVLIGRGMKS